MIKLLKAHTTVMKRSTVSHTYWDENFANVPNLKIHFSANVSVWRWILSLKRLLKSSRWMDGAKDRYQLSKEVSLFVTFLLSRVSLYVFKQPWTSVLVFATDPSELRLVSEVRRLRRGEPAALAGVRPQTSPLLQLGSELLTVRHVVPTHTYTDRQTDRM